MEPAIDQSRQGQPAEENQQFLTFTLGDEVYGIDILRVQEIRAWEGVREIPNTPDYIKGVLNLRGVIVPVVDLRVRFRLEQVEYQSTTVIIVLSVNIGDSEHTLGVVVDGVSDVLNSSTAQLQAAPNLGTRVSTRFIESMVVTEGGMVVLLSAGKLLDVDELALIETLEQQD